PVQHRYFCRQPGWQSPPVDSRFGIRTGRTGLLVEVRKQGFERWRRILKRGDRVAVIGHGIAIVRTIYEGQVCAVLSNQTVLEIGRKQIVWDEANVRWEANYSGVSRTDRAGVIEVANKPNRRGKAWITSTKARKSGP